MIESGKLSGKRVLVTGSGTGIGRAVALEFAREGADVAFHYAHSEEGVRPAVEEACGLGVKAAAFQADFNHLDQVRRLAREAAGFLGGMDVLVNNSGITFNLPFEEVTPEQFDTLYHVNVRASFFLTQALVPMMREAAGGAVINLTSIHAFAGMQEHSVYAGTKGAIVAYTRALAIELAPQRIRVNAIAPGAIEVENYYKVIPGFDPKAAAVNIPAGFIGQGWDIARLAVFLASEDARYILGQTFIVDGGTTSWMPLGISFRERLGSHFGQGYVPGV